MHNFSGHHVLHVENEEVELGHWFSECGPWITEGLLEVHKAKTFFAFFFFPVSNFALMVQKQ